MNRRLFLLAAPAIVAAPSLIDQWVEDDMDFANNIADQMEHEMMMLVEWDGSSNWVQHTVQRVAT